MTGKTILLVEDNPKVMRNNITMLKSQGALVLAAENLAQARQLLFNTVTAAQDKFDKSEHLKTFDAAVIDIMLPDGSGLSLLEEIRKSSSNEVSALPVLLLTAMGENDDIVKGLTLGADDYLAKPYDLNVLTARLNAILRRTAGARTRTVADNLSIGSLSLDLIAHKATIGGRELAMTQKEFAILFLLVQNEGELLSAKYLYEKVWKHPFDETIHENLLRVHISNLKKKISDCDAEFVIETSWGDGYRLAAL